MLTILLALIVLLTFWGVSKLLAKKRIWFYKFSRKSLIIDLWHQSSILSIRVLGIIITLQILGAGAVVGAILGTAGVIGLGISFAFKDIVENYIAGIILSIRQPFLKGDYVKLGDIEGVIQRMTTRMTMMKSFDGNNISIPNATVFNSNIINFSKNPYRRFDFLVGIDTNSSPLHTIHVGVSALKDFAEIETHPPSFGIFEDIGANTLNIRFFGWVDQRKFDFAQVRGIAIAIVMDEIEASGVTFPEPSQTIHFQDVEKMEKAPKKKPSMPFVKVSYASLKQVDMVKKLMQLEDNETDLLSDKAAE